MGRFYYESDTVANARFAREKSEVHNVMIAIAENLKDGERLLTAYSDWYTGKGPQDFTFCVSQGEGEPEIRMAITVVRIGVNPFLQVQPGSWCRRWEKKRLSLKKAIFDPREFLALVRETAAQKGERETAEAESRRKNTERIAEASKVLGFRTDEYLRQEDRGGLPFDRVSSDRKIDGSLEFVVNLAPHRLTANGVLRLEALLREELGQPRSNITPGAVDNRPFPDCTCLECADCHTPTVCAACLICTRCSHHMPGCSGCPASYGAQEDKG